MKVNISASYLFNRNNDNTIVVKYKAIEDGMKVNSMAIMSIIDGLGGYSKLGKDYLKESGIDNISADPTIWYEQQSWLDAFRKINDKIGPAVLYQIGKRIPSNAIFPPDIDNIASGLQSINIAYHLNHMNVNNEVLYDENRIPKMIEGIGHYGYEKVKGENKVIMCCDNCYPDDFDRGIITAMAQRFEENAVIEHDDEKPCRDKGDESCTYIISW